MEKAPVPKFGSFKPKAAHKKEDPSASEVKSPSRERHRRREQNHERHERDGQHPSRDHRHRDERRPREERRHRERDHVKPRSPTPQVDPDEFQESKLFVVDRRGDAKNVEYGSLHRYNIPSYHRIGYGNVIGLSTQAKIDREASSEKEVALTAVDRKTRLRLPRLLTGKAGRSQEIRLHYVLNAADVPTDLESDYLELRPTRKRKRGSDSPEPDGIAVDYRSIEGKAKAPIHPADEDLTFASDPETDNGSDALELQVRQQNALLSKATKVKPGELAAWYALVEHQARMVHPGVDIVSFTSSERRAGADLRLSILQQAASHITEGSPGRDQLLLRTIEEGSIIWDSTKLSSKWKEALIECPSSILLWTHHLDHVQDRHTGFRYEECKASFSQCLQILREAFARGTSDEQTRVGELQIYVLLRLTTFVRDAGYLELAVATWQALLEYHFFTPHDLIAATLEDRLESFESFWDSEVPRIGDHNAKGWRRYHESGDDEGRQSNPSRHPPLDPGRPWASFAKYEASLGGFCLPASADDDDAVADPFRCVMFSDVRDVLQATDGNLKASTLIPGLLAFLELPDLPCTEVHSDDDIWRLDPHVAGYEAYCAVDLLQLPHDPASKLRHCRETSESLFAREGAFNAFRRCYGQDERYNDLVRFVDRSLEALVTQSKHDDALAEYYLAFKHQLFPEEAARSAKKLLKERSSSLRLYNAYAMIESQLGHGGKAQNVWATALGMQSSLDDSAQDDAVFLWHSRMLSAAPSSNSALQHLLDISKDQSGISDVGAGQQQLSVERLKATRKLQEAFDRMMLAGKQVHAALFADCLAWLAYLGNHHDLDGSFHAYEKCASRMARENAKLSLEVLQQCKAGLIEHHIKLQRPYRPAVFRQEVEDSLKLYPNNSLLIHLAQRLATQDRIRTLVHDQGDTEPNQRTIVQWPSKITEELRRIENASSGSTVNTVRATFTSALLGLDSKVKHAPSLWFMWLRFECTQASKSASGGPSAFVRARQVFLDGLRHLPWHKNWAIAGMNYFSEHGMGQEGLRQIHDTLVDRGLRLRVDVESML